MALLTLPTSTASHNPRMFVPMVDLCFLCRHCSLSPDLNLFHHNSPPPQSTYMQRCSHKITRPCCRIRFTYCRSSWDINKWVYRKNDHCAIRVGACTHDGSRCPSSSRWPKYTWLSTDSAANTTQNNSTPFHHHRYGSTAILRAHSFVSSFLDSPHFLVHCQRLTRP